MDVREKLEVIAHLGEHITYKEDIGICYDSALAKVIEDAYMELKNGVTVQEWISVKDERKPNHGDIAICYMTFGEYRLLQWDDRSKLWVGDYMDFEFEDAAYWQMPQQPKGE